MALKLDNNLLEELGLGALPEHEKQLLLRQIYEKLEMNVGVRLADQMSNEQLDEFEKFVDANDDKGAFQWLESNFPNYKDVVNQEFEKLKGEIRQYAPQMLAIAQQAQQAGAVPQAVPGAPSAAGMPQGPQPQMPSQPGGAMPGQMPPSQMPGQPDPGQPQYGAPAPMGSPGGPGAPMPGGPQPQPYQPMPAGSQGPAGMPTQNPYQVNYGMPQPGQFAQPQPGQPQPGQYAQPQPQPGQFAQPGQPMQPGQFGQPQSGFPQQQPPAGPGQ